MEERHRVITLHAALCRTSKRLVAVLQGNENHPGEAYVSRGRTKAL